MFGYIFICCVAAIIPAFLITYRISDVYTKYRSPEKRQEAVELARKEGRYATAKLISEGARAGCGTNIYQNSMIRIYRIG